METLDPRSQDIIRARWLDDDNKATLHELAERYGISAERVRQLENNAMKKLRSAFALNRATVPAAAILHGRRVCLSFFRRK